MSRIPTENGIGSRCPNIEMDAIAVTAAMSLLSSLALACGWDISQFASYQRRYVGMALSDNALKRARKELTQLQERAAVVHADLRRTHRSLYEHLASVYLWWRQAREIDGYLDDEYAALGLKKRTVAGINFRPLLVLVWGFNNTTPQQTALHSRALNAIHDEYEARPELYAKDGVAKLANFIEQSGGATKLAGYGQQDDADDPTGDGDADEVEEARQFRLIDPAILRETQAKLLSDAQKHAQLTPMTALPALAGIDVEAGEMGLVLVRGSGEGLKVVTYQSSDAIIDEMLVATYRRRFEVQHPKMRPLLELLQTQCLPVHLEGLQATVEAKVLKKRAWAKGGKIGARRVLYRHETGTLLLSPTGTDTGVVSCVTPRQAAASASANSVFQPILADCGHDVFIAPAQRTELEERCLRKFEFNHFDVGGGAQVATYDVPNSASHLLTLTHIVNKRDRLHIPFWPFYNTLDTAFQQVVPNPSYSFSPAWQSHFTPAALGRLDRQFVTPWLNSHAKHFTRDKQAVIQVTFAPDQLRFEFVFQNGEFENKYEFLNDAMTDTGKSVVAQFASIDLMPVLASLSLLPIAQSASFAVDSHQLRIAFGTIEGGPLHEIYVPALDSEGNRSTAAFTTYEPKMITDSGLEGVAA